MRKPMYMSPVFLAANGTITLTTSQLAELGVSDVAEWDAYWADAADSCIYDDFDVNDSSTWPEGFSLSDPTSWDILIGF